MLLSLVGVPYLVPSCEFNLLLLGLGGIAAVGFAI